MHVRLNAMKIVGICLVQDDDLWVEQAIRGVIDFCDQLIICLHRSRDGTTRIVERLQQQYRNIELHHIEHPRQSHELIRAYAGTETWIFGVDGDELYEPDRLRQLKERIISGVYATTWQLLGKVLHCDEIDLEARLAHGYLARPSRSMTKLYNFSLIEDWRGNCSERLHDGEIVFKDEEHRNRKDHTESEISWEQAVFRCLHMVFVRRSSLQSEGAVSRPNIAEINAFSRMEKLKFYLLRALRREPESQTKRLTYQRGERVCLSVDTFFQSSTHHE